MKLKLKGNCYMPIVAKSDCENKDKDKDKDKNKNKDKNEEQH